MSELPTLETREDLYDLLHGLNDRGIEPAAPILDNTGQFWLVYGRDRGEEISFGFVRADPTDFLYDGYFEHVELEESRFPVILLHMPTQ